MSGSGPKAANTSWRSSSESLSRVSSSWLRTNVAHWQSGWIFGLALSALASGRASWRASARYMSCMPMKSNIMVSSSPSEPPK